MLYPNVIVDCGRRHVLTLDTRWRPIAELSRDDDLVLSLESQRSAVAVAKILTSIGLHCQYADLDDLLPPLP